MSSRTKWVVAGCAIAGVAALMVSLKGRAESGKETALNRAERLVRQAQHRVFEMQNSLEAFRKTIAPAAGETAT